MSFYVPTPLVKPRQDDLVEEAARERLARDGSPASLSAALRGPASWVHDRIAAVADHGRRAHATAKDAVAPQPGGRHAHSRP